MKYLLILILVNIKIELPKFIFINRATTYYCEESQCDNEPFITADGSIIDPIKLMHKKIKWVALSRDLIKNTYRNNYYSVNDHWNGYFEFGDTIYVTSKSSPQINGYWIVHDCMNARYKNSIDFLIDPINDTPKLGVCNDVIIYLK